MPFAAFTPEFLAELTKRAQASPRRRQHHNIHADLAEPVQRLFNAICPDSYIRPHRHSLDPKQELLIAVRGRFALVLFDDAGDVTQCVPFGCRDDLAAGVEVAPSQWHTVLALDDGSVLLEVKQGPFDPHAAKEPAAWSPPEGDPAAPAYLRRLKDRAMQMELVDSVRLR